MRKSLTLWQLIGFIFTAIAGVLLHFAYDWSNQSPIIAPFAAVNESIWEHMKLLFFSMFIFAFIESCFLGDEYENFWCAKLIGILSGVLLIPVLYYTYTGVFGVSLDWINIIIFFVAATTAYLLETRLLHREHGRCFPRIALGILYVLAFIFVVLTYIPPNIPLFEDPMTGNYGVAQFVHLTIPVI